MSLGSRAANSLWIASLLPEWRRFWGSMERLEETQARLLRGYLKANRGTEYGRRHGFASITSARQYQKTVPLTTYDDYTEAIDRIGRGAKAVLTETPVRLFEPSSGSTGASKLIPYTGELRAEFARGIAPWIVDLYLHRPELLGGSAYWSITPLTAGPRSTPCGIPVGFEEDSAYLGSLGKRLVDSVLAVPNDVKRIGDVDAFRYATLLFLLRQRSLRLISVWSPTYLELLLRFLPDWWDRLLEDICRGTLNSPGDIDPAVHDALAKRLPRDPYRARELEAVAPIDFRSIWPRLSLLSCWADGPSELFAGRLSTRFPGVLVQPKGLLATEAFVSIPQIAAPAPVLAARSHFFEFLPMEGGLPVEDWPLLAHETETGQLYAVVVTTGGGFYRYQLRDLVEVVGRYRGLPCLRFVGKTDRVSDWFGEKLDEGFVAGVVARLYHACGVSPAFSLLAPDDGESGFRYALYLDAELPSSTVGSMAKDLDGALRQNFHYDYCRRLGQLGQAEVVLVAPEAQELCLRVCRERGQRLGNIKPPLLDGATGWQSRFGPYRPMGDTMRCRFGTGGEGGI